MLRHSGSVLFFLAVLGVAVACSTTASANFSIFPSGNTVVTGSGSGGNQWDVAAKGLQSVKATTPPIVTDTAFRQALADNFAAMDTNGDGVVTYAEAVAYLPGLTPAQFALVDANGDGKITPAEAGIAGAGCSCAAIDLSDPSSIIVAVLASIGLVLGYFHLCSSCSDK